MKKFIIFCDLEGKIKSLVNQQQGDKLLGYQADELLNKKRIFSLFSINSALEYLDFYSKIKEKECCKLNMKKEKQFNSKAILKDKSGNLFLADVSINPAYKEGHKIGHNYLFSVSNENVVKNQQSLFSIKKFFQKWSIIVRLKFMLAIIIPLILGIIWSTKYIPFNMLSVKILIALFIGAILMHIGANTFNDYFDWKSGADKINVDYLMFSSGGSRSIDYGLISEKKLFLFSCFTFTIVAFIGFYLTTIRGVGILIFGTIGALSAYFYTAPPFKFSSRFGLGEILIFLSFGPLFVAGVIFALTGKLNFSNFLIAVPFGFLITAVLFVNEYPDFDSDRASLKNNLLVTIGKKYFTLGLFILIFSAYFTTLLCVFNKNYPVATLLSFLSFPFALSILKLSFKLDRNKKNIIKICENIFPLYLFFALLFIFGILLN